MTISRNRGFAALGAAALAFFAAAPALAQATAAPRSLSGQQTSHPAAAEKAPAPQTAPGHRGETGITVSTLGETEGPPAGTLDSTNGGLGEDLWSGTARNTAEDIMARLPLATTVAPVRALARRIVLTKAAAPIGEADQAFVTLRIRQLLDAGLLDDAAALATMAQVPNDPSFARAQAEAILFAGESAHVCDQTTETRLKSSEPFWIELRAYCYAMAGNDDALSLTRSVMSAQNIDDPAFDTLLEDIQKHYGKAPGNIANPNALDAYLLGQAGIGVDFDTGAQLGMPGLLLALRNAQNSPEDRLKAAQRLLETGALSSQDLILVADAQHFTASQFQTEYMQLRTLPFIGGQALLRQDALRTSPDAQPALSYEALGQAETKGHFGVAAILQQQVIEKIVPDTSMHGMADLMGRALMLTGNSDAAARWAALLDPRLQSDKPLVAKFQVELNLVGSDPPRRAAAALGLSQLAKEIANKTYNRQFAALALALYDALGEPMPADAKAAADAVMNTKWSGRRPAQSTMTRLDEAVHAPGRKGETLMLVLNAIGAHGPADMAPDALGHLIRILMQEGVPGAARNIAIAALLRYRAPSLHTPLAPKI